MGGKGDGKGDGKGGGLISFAAVRWPKYKSEDHANGFHFLLL